MFKFIRKKIARIAAPGKHAAMRVAPKKVTETLEAELKRLVDQIIHDESPRAGNRILDIISEQNQRSEFILSSLAKIPNVGRVSKSSNLEVIAKELLLALDVTPKMQESVANIYRPRFGSSYRFQRAAFWRIAQFSTLNPNKIARKNAARRFASLIGLRVPKLYQEGVSHKEVEVRPDCVIKPSWEDGGKGVHGLVSSGGGYSDLFDSGRQYSGAAEVRQKLAGLLENRNVRRDEWIVEEFVLPPSGKLEDARDLKFFMFYGKVGYVLQVDRWSGAKPVRAMFNETGQAVDVSSFYTLPEQPFPAAFNKADLDYVAEISKCLPWPGIRIDFLNGRDGLVFGEFTVNPGAYGGFHDGPDRFLGNLWAEAAGRLYDDLLRGKRFDEYCDFLQVNPNSLGAANGKQI